MGEKSIKVNIFFNTLKTLSGVLVPLIIFPYVSRILLTENIGKVNFAASIVSYFTLIASLGISTYAVRECAKNRDNKAELEDVAGQLFSINFYMSIIAYIALAITLVAVRSLDAYRNLIIILSTAILFTTLGADWINSAMEDFTYIAIRTFVFQALSLVAIFCFVRTIDDYVKYAIITAVSSGGANVLNFFYRRKYCRIKLKKPSVIEWKKHMAPILFLFVMILSQTIFSNADITMLGFLCDDNEVGLYSTAHKIENIISQILSSMSFVMIPKLSRLFNENDFDKTNRFLTEIFGVFMFVGLPCFVGIVSIAKELILVVVGEEFIGAVLPLQILMISFLFSLFGGSFLGNMVLLPSGNEKKFMIVCCITAVVNVLANFFLIPKWGASGAAGTTAGCSLIIAILLFLLKDKRIKVLSFKHTLISPFIGSVAIFTFCFLIKRVLDSLVIKAVVCIGGGVVLYILILLLFRNEFLFKTFKFAVDKFKGKKNND